MEENKLGIELKVAERPEITKEMVEQDTRKLAEVIAAACADKKARDIVFMNMDGLVCCLLRPLHYAGPLHR